jgi:hypothetical protein
MDMTDTVLPAPKPLPSAEAHAPLMVRNDVTRNPATATRSDASGPLSMIMCSCGAKPAKPAARTSTMHVWQAQHARKVLGRDCTVPMVYGSGCTAEGLTWDEWYAVAPGLSPFTGQPS